MDQAKKTWHIEVGDSQDLSIEEIWPDGDAPENPTTEDVIAVLRQEGEWKVQHDWGFGFHLEVDYKHVPWHVRDA